MDFFRVFGVKPIAGRTFLDEEVRPGAKSVAVISYALWQNRFAMDPAAVGTTIGVDGSATTIVGIMPAGFDYPNETEIWTPKYFESSIITQTQIQRGASYLLYYARLADGVDIRSAEAEIATLSHQYDESHQGFGDTGREMRTTPLRESLVSDIRRTLLVLLGAVAFVLLIASANIANLLLARAVARQKEVAIRASLGASRSRLLVQFLTESVLLAAFGAALGVLLSVWSLRLIIGIGPAILPRASEVRIDTTVLIFTIAVAVLTGILFGLRSGDARRAHRSERSAQIQQPQFVGRRKAARRDDRFRSRPRDGPADRRGVADAQFPAPGKRLSGVSAGKSSHHAHRTFGRALSAARATGGFLRSDPGACRHHSFRSTGRAGQCSARQRTQPSPIFSISKAAPRSSPPRLPPPGCNSISPDYFQTLEIPILAGRTFTPGGQQPARRWSP